MAALWPGRGGPVIDYISAPPSREWQRKRPRRVALLGSTGSIGRNAVRVIAGRPDLFEVEALACGRNAQLMAEQAIQFRPAWLACQDEATARELCSLLPQGYSPEIVSGREGFAAVASLPRADTVLSAQAGSAGLCGTLAAALAGKVICLANKESLVMAGELLRRICESTGAAILPVDSEHNAIFQCLAGRGQEIAGLILTASGGPFLGRSRAELRHVRPEDALRHPTWKMGAKISIDSASMMNKGLEIIEACHLFGVSPDFVRVLVHPQSLVHSLVELADHSLLAQLGAPDMRMAISHCLCWPGCAPVGVPRLDLAAAGPLAFSEPDTQTFPCMDLARQAFAGGQAACIALNAANEAAVEAFLQQRAAFTRLDELVAAALAALAGENLPREPGRRGPGEDAAAAAMALLEAMDRLDLAARALVESCLGQ